MTKDILIDFITQDLKFSNGDFAIGDSNEQHVVLIVNTNLGSWKQFPLCGVGVHNYLGSSNKVLSLKRLINLQLSQDGFTNINVSSLNLGENFQYSINAERLE